MQKIILSLGISLDGYIAKKDGDVNWMEIGQGDNDNGQELLDLVKNTIADTGIVVMGRAAYDVTASFGPIDETLKGAKKIIVLTTSKIDDDKVETFSGNVKEIVDKENDGIWIFGGGNVAAQFLDQNLVTHIELGIVPVLLGDGIPLWQKNNSQSEWILDETNKLGNTLQLKYSKK